MKQFFLCVLLCLAVVAAGLGLEFLFEGGVSESATAESDEIVFDSEEELRDYVQDYMEDHYSSDQSAFNQESYEEGARDGWREGYDEGYVDGYQAGYEDGANGAEYWEP